MNPDALTIATGGLLTGAPLAIAALGLLPLEVATGPLLGGLVRQRINRTRENDEALLLALGLL